MKNPKEARWLREMLVRKELGYLPTDPMEFEFVSSFLEETQRKSEKVDTKEKLRYLIKKNK